jgi:phosphopantothenoylcysteine decarboxylase
MSRILLGVTGSVAAVKTPELYRLLRQAGHEVKVAATRWSLTFFDPEDLEPAAVSRPESLLIRDQTTLYLDEDEWPHGRRFEIGEPVLHIELRKWADALLIAPLDANTLAKLALGFCDNLLTCVYRAWDFNRPVIMAPAMNTMMWENPVTARHLLQLLEDHGGRAAPGLTAGDLVTAINETCPHLRVIGPVSKRLACGDEGVGGMSDLPSIVAALSEPS